MRRYLHSLFISFALLICVITNLAGQAFNPYQHAYQGWNGDKIRKAGAFRAFLNKFSLNVSLGYGRTFYSHEVTSDVLETPDQLTILGDYTIAGDQVTYTGVTNWLNYPMEVQATEDISLGSGNRILYADSSSIKYGGSGYNLPLRVGLHLDIDRFRIGGGILYELHGIKQLNPREQGNYPYVPNFSTTGMFRYYFNVGGKVYHIKGWDYHVDIEIGKVIYGKKYDKTTLQNGLYFNLGLPVEYELSEYFWVVVRPSFDFKSYSMAVPYLENGGTGPSPTIQHNQPAFYVNVGVRMKLPEIKRCPVKSCRTQLKHVHGSREFRGQPFYMKQNPKIGELYRKLEHQKRKNRRKSGLKK